MGAKKGPEWEKDSLNYYSAEILELETKLGANQDNNDPEVQRALSRNPETLRYPEK